MNAISQILTADQILLDLDASSKKRVFEHAGMLFEQKLGMPRASIFDSLFAREKLGSTGLGQGIAIPHGRIKGLKQAAGAVIRLQTPIPFDSPDGKPVTLLFVLLVPEQATEEHLQILSELAQRFSDRSFREKLQNAADAAGVLALFDAAEH
ncbi:PTS sugar transporter subunit IIA [Azonexus hydrophilus]|jgi:nitrogen PTS system EIIA component|uniref:PTS IIA-like nitrogen regulatory protein PtsN n=1 Tax=Azonexus hydrophilus TaxID=418702 RepID=UPI00175CDF73|nr:PTS IIA-like nitrogen regulatory protein PtsN [Azonexus hydrophilus]HHV48230.1 PTS IIA-like nitrogen regulatory protein PtsN [Rhodocyclaceae bacterium]